MTISDQIAATRESIRTLRERYERALAAESAQLERHLDELCLALYTEAGTVTAVARAYGTKDRRTIMERLERARGTLPESAPPEHVTVTPDADTAHVWTVATPSASVQMRWPSAAVKPRWVRPKGGYSDAQRELAAKILNEPDSSEYKALAAARIGG